MQEQIAEIIELIKMLPEPERAAYLSRLHDIANSSGPRCAEKESR